MVANKSNSHLPSQHHRSSGSISDLLLDTFYVSCTCKSSRDKETSSHTKGKVLEDYTKEDLSDLFLMASISLNDSSTFLESGDDKEEDQDTTALHSFFDQEQQKFEWKEHLSILTQLKTSRLSTIVEDDHKPLFCARWTKNYHFVGGR